MISNFQSLFCSSIGIISLDLHVVEQSYSTKCLSTMHLALSYFFDASQNTDHNNSEPPVVYQLGIWIRSDFLTWIFCLLEAESSKEDIYYDLSS